MSYSAYHRSHRDACNPKARGSGGWAGRDPGAETPSGGAPPPRPAGTAAVMDLNLSVQRHGDRATIQVGGEVDLATCPQLQAVLGELVDGGFHHLIIDLEQVSFLDCSGIRVLVYARRRVQEHSGSVRLARPTPFVWRVLALTGMTTVFPIDSSVGEALATEPVGPRTPS
jgi:anti-sigma B factor antagonist